MARSAFKLLQLLGAAPLFFCSFVFVYIVEARGRASTMNRSGCNSQKQDAKHTCMGWTRWMQEETPRRENWKIGRTNDLGGVHKGRKDHGFGLGMI